MNQRNSVKEVLWVVGIFMIAFALLYFSTEPTIFTNEYIEYGNSETPIYLRPWFILLFTFFLLLLITYFIKEALSKFRDIAGNIILSLAIMGNILTVSVLIKTLAQFTWTLYPPHSGLAEFEKSYHNFNSTLFPTLICIQFLLISTLLMVGIRIGALSKHRPTTTPGWRG